MDEARSFVNVESEVQASADGKRKIDAKLSCFGLMLGRLVKPSHGRRPEDGNNISKHASRWMNRHLPKREQTRSKSQPCLLCQTTRSADATQTVRNMDTLGGTWLHPALTRAGVVAHTLPCHLSIALCARSLVLIHHRKKHRHLHTTDETTERD